MFRRLGLMTALVAIVAQSRPVCGCGFVELAGYVTLREDAAASKIVVFGRLENALKTADGGTTDFVIIKTLKGGRILEGKKVVRIPRYIPVADPKNLPQLLCFGEVTKGEVDLFKSVPGNLELVEYIQGIMSVDEKDRIKVMRYCFDFLDHDDPIIAADAFGEFLKSSDPDIRKIGRILSADKLRRWIQNGKTSPERLRLYAFLLASCGDQQDVQLLRKLLDRLVAEEFPPLIDGILTGYTLLSPKDGWKYTAKLMSDPATKFTLRWASIRAARYFYTNQPEVVPDEEIFGAISCAILQTDMADIPITHLRQSKRWKLTDQILSLSKKRGFDTRLIRLSIVCYALQCPDARAARFVAGMRESDPLFVADAEEIVRAEAKRVVEKP